MQKYIEVRRCHVTTSKRTLLGREAVTSAKKNQGERQRLAVSASIPADCYAVLVSYRVEQEEFINY